VAVAQLVAGTLWDAFSLGVTAVLLVGWAAVLLGVLRLTTSTSARSAGPASSGRRNLLRLSATVLLAVAAGGGVIGELLRRSQETALAQAIARGDPVPGVSLGAVASAASAFPCPILAHLERGGRWFDGYGCLDGGATARASGRSGRHRRSVDDRPAECDWLC
jgi:hypothetical protein